VAWLKTHRFCVLGPFSCAHSFGVLRWFAMPMTLSTCLSDMIKNSSFLVYGLFCELLTTVLGFRGDLQGPRHCTCLSGMTKNSSFLCFRAIFMWYCPQFWGSGVIYKAHDT
jgi:hypothetical protein